jgi:hypothetical protein
MDSLSLVGREVSIKEVKSKPELNGQIGLAESLITESGRYVIKLPNDVQVALKPANLTTIKSLVGLDVIISGIRSQPTLNGCMGKVESYVVQSGRYLVALPDRKPMSLKRDNLREATEDEKTTIRAERRRIQLAEAEAKRLEHAARLDARRNRKKEKQIAEAARKQEEHRQRQEQRKLAKALYADDEKTVERKADTLAMTEENKGRIASQNQNRVPTNEMRQLGWGAKKRIKP